MNNAIAEEPIRSACAAVCPAIVLAAISFFVMVASASATITFCPPGTGAGQCKEPAGIATDFETGRVYVADRDNNRVDVFQVEGGGEVKFQFAFGWGVDTGASQFQVCTTASSCQAGLTGSGAGQLSHPRTVAVDNAVGSTSMHDVYVGEGGNFSGSARIQKFDSTGTFLLAFGWGVRNGAAEAQQCGPQATPPTAGCLPGLEGKGECQFAGRESEPLAVGPGGTVEVADSPRVNAIGENPERFNGRIERFTPAGVCAAEAQLLEEQTTSFFRSFAVDSTGNSYLSLFSSGGPAGFFGVDGSADITCEDTETQTDAVAVDESGRIFAVQKEFFAEAGQAFLPLSEYGSACNPLKRFGYETVLNDANGIAAFHSPGGDLLITQNSARPITYLSLPSAGPTVVPSSAEARPVSSTKATLRALVNPNGKATEAHVEFVKKATCEKDVSEGHGCFDHATDSEPEPIGATDVKLHSLSAQFGCRHPLTEFGTGNCLTPETEYRFRVIAENADGEGNSPLDGGSFTTKPWLQFGATWTSDVGTDSARLHAEVNPFGVPTTGYFELVDDAQFQASGFADAIRVPDPSRGQAPLETADTEALSALEASASPLLPGTTYHYRLAAQNSLIEPSFGPTGEFHTFSTPDAESCPANEAFRTGPSALLPDCRAYELVSPPQKSGDVTTLLDFVNTPATLDQSAVSGSRYAYGSYRAFDGALSAPWTAQYIASRSEAAQEWINHPISPPRTTRIYEDVLSSGDTEFKAFSPDLCQSWLRTVSDPPLAAGGQVGYPNLYRKADDECAGPSYETLTDQDWSNVAPSEPIAARMELQGLSVDGSDAVFVAPESFSGTGAPKQPFTCATKSNCQTELYIRAGDQAPVFVCVPPPGELTSELGCSAGTNSVIYSGHNRSAALQNAISANGERVFWTDHGLGPGKIYMREHAERGKVSGECSGPAKPCTIAVSRKGEELSATTSSEFVAAASDGSKALFTTGDDRAESDLYEYLTATGETQLIAHKVIGIAGVSENSSAVYYASRQKLGAENDLGEEAQAGGVNLYLDDGGETAFIATLSAQDGEAGLASPLNPEPWQHLARVTPDGRRAAFVSSAPLTGYDNTDLNFGRPDDEVFVYDEPTHELTCASCNPSGERPTGLLNEPGPHTTEVIREGPRWLAGYIPTFENTLYASRVLSDDGTRLFFNSRDALAGGDTNGATDVYEWEAVGAGSCTEASTAFSFPAGGCVFLISSGKSPRDSQFHDASPSGNDVFFTTLSSLLPQDPGLVDVYDARAGGGFPPPPAQPAACEGEACQAPPAPPNDPTPASSTAEGAGNVAESVKRRCPRGKVRRHGNCVRRAPHKRRHLQKRSGRKGGVER